MHSTLSVLNCFITAVIKCYDQLMNGIRVKPSVESERSLIQHLSHSYCSQMFCFSSTMNAQVWPECHQNGQQYCPIDGQ